MLHLDSTVSKTGREDVTNCLDTENYEIYLLFLFGTYSTINHTILNHHLVKIISHRNQLHYKHIILKFQSSPYTPFPTLPSWVTGSTEFYKTINRRVIQTLMQVYCSNKGTAETRTLQWNINLASFQDYLINVVVLNIVKNCFVISFTVKAKSILPKMK